MSDEKESFCEIPTEPDYSKPTQVELSLAGGVKDFPQAHEPTESTADAELDDYMLLSFYDRDNNIESSRNASELN